MGSEKRYAVGGRLANLLAVMVVVLSVMACSDDPDAADEETTTSSGATTSASRVTTSSSVVILEEIPTEPSTTPTTESFPGLDVLVYFQDIQSLSVRVGDLVLDMRAANNDWDNRTKTYSETEATMVDIERRARVLRDDIALIEPPAERGLPVEHQTAWMAVGQMTDAAIEALAGLRSTDEGQQRRAAVTMFLVAYERYNAAFGRIVDIIGVSDDVSLPTVATTSAPTTAATTTTTTVAATTTATTVATAATTSTTAAPTTTSTTQASGVDTVPPAPDIGYTILIEEASPLQGAQRTWLTVSVDEGATKDDLAQVGRRLAFEYRVALGYQALLIYFVHFPEEVDTLGTWIHAPFGDWNRAAEVSPGDYSQHLVDDRTVEKDWTLLPTDAQVDLYNRYRDYKDNVSYSGDGTPSDEQLIPLAAQEFGVTPAEVRQAVDAWRAWQAN